MAVKVSHQLVQPGHHVGRDDLGNLYRVLAHGGGGGAGLSYISLLGEKGGGDLFQSEKPSKRVISKLNFNE